MKKLICTFVLLTFTGVFELLDAQSTDLNGNCFMTDTPITYVMPGSNDVTPSLLMQYNIRALTEINKTDTAEAYPYLSPDGLRLYFAQGVPGSSGLYYVSRTNTSSYFSNKQLVSSYFSGNQQKGCWLTNDEKEIFYVDNDVLYYASRSSISSSFSAPVIVNLIGNPVTTIYGPSLSPDKQELYLTASSSNKSILRFQKTANLQYTLTDTLHVPSNYNAGPGQLSKDGLKFYAALFISIENKTKLFQYSRSSLSSTFDALTLMLLDVSINDINYSSNTQPSVSADGNIIVWVRNACGIVWNDNDLFIATNTSVGKQEITFGMAPAVYPNPARDIVNIEGIADVHCEMLIYNHMGELVHHQFLENKSNTINISSLPKGIYIIALNGAVNFYYKLVKN